MSDRELVRLAVVALAVARESSRFKRDDGYDLCGSNTESPVAFGETMRIRTLVPVGLLTVVPSCVP